MDPYVIKLEELGMNDVETVGGKNASLGEMISNLSSAGLAVPGGFATTAAAYHDFLRTDDLDKRIYALLDDLDVDDIDALIKADKDFDLLIVPGAGHGVGERPYASRRRMDFFVRHLLDVEPRAAP